MQRLTFYKIRKKIFYDEENLILKNVLEDQNFNELDSIVKEYDDSPLTQFLSFQLGMRIYNSIYLKEVIFRLICNYLVGMVIILPENHSETKKFLSKKIG